MDASPRHHPSDLIEVALETSFERHPASQSSPAPALGAHRSASLAGEHDALKEYTLGVEVFERGARFDPRADAIVRVEARRLREKLRTYYRGEGATDLVTISIPPGACRPMFHLHEDPPAAILDDPDALCCQAESLILRSTPESIARACRYLQSAVARWPPRYAELHAMLAMATLTGVVMEFPGAQRGHASGARFSPPGLED